MRNFHFHQRTRLVYSCATDPSDVRVRKLSPGHPGLREHNEWVDPCVSENWVVNFRSPE